MGKRRQKLGEPRRLLGDLVLVEETTRLAMPRAPSSAISLVPTNQSHFIRSTGREGKQNRLDRRCWAMLYFFRPPYSSCNRHHRTKPNRRYRFASSCIIIIIIIDTSARQLFFFLIFHLSTGDGHGGEEEKCIGRLGPRSESRHLLTGLSWENGCGFCTWCFGVV